MEESSEAVQQQILSHLKAIPVFDRLEDNELGKIYEICTFSKFQADEVIYKFGAASDDLFILLDGQLVAKSKAGVDIAYISPIGIVGEMGVLTDQPRSADVVALEEAVGFVITKEALISLFIADSGVCRKILLNLVKTLSNKLYDTNAEIEKLRAQVTQPGSDQPKNDNIFLY